MSEEFDAPRVDADGSLDASIMMDLDAPMEPRVEEAGGMRRNKKVMPRPKWQLRKMKKGGLEVQKPRLLDVHAEMGRKRTLLMKRPPKNQRKRLGKEDARPVSFLTSEDDDDSDYDDVRESRIRAMNTHGQEYTLMERMMISTTIARASMLDPHVMRPDLYRPLRANEQMDSDPLIYNNIWYTDLSQFGRYQRNTLAYWPSPFYRARFDRFRRSDNRFITPPHPMEENLTFYNTTTGVIPETIQRGGAIVFRKSDYFPPPTSDDIATGITLDVDDRPEHTPAVESLMPHMGTCDDLAPERAGIVDELYEGKKTSGGRPNRYFTPILSEEDIALLELLTPPPTIEQRKGVPIQSLNKQRTVFDHIKDALPGGAQLFNCAPIESERNEERLDDLSATLKSFSILVSDTWQHLFDHYSRVERRNRRLKREALAREHGMDEHDAPTPAPAHTTSSKPGNDTTINNFDINAAPVMSEMDVDHMTDEKHMTLFPDSMDGDGDHTANPSFVDGVGAENGDNSSMDKALHEPLESTDAHDHEMAVDNDEEASTIKFGEVIEEAKAKEPEEEVSIAKGRSRRRAATRTSMEPEEHIEEENTLEPMNELDEELYYALGQGEDEDEDEWRNRLSSIVSDRFYAMTLPMNQMLDDDDEESDRRKKAMRRKRRMQHADGSELGPGESQHDLSPENVQELEWEQWEGSQENGDYDLESDGGEKRNLFGNPVTGENVDRSLNQPVLYKLSGRIEDLMEDAKELVPPPLTVTDEERFVLDDLRPMPHPFVIGRPTHDVVTSELFSILDELMEGLLEQAANVDGRRAMNATTMGQLPYDTRIYIAAFDEMSALNPPEALRDAVWKKLQLVFETPGFQKLWPRGIGFKEARHSSRVSPWEFVKVHEKSSVTDDRLHEYYTAKKRFLEPLSEEESIDGGDEHELVKPAAERKPKPPISTATSPARPRKTPAPKRTSSWNTSPIIPITPPPPKPPSRQWELRLERREKKRVATALAAGTTTDAPSNRRSDRLAPPPGAEPDPEANVAESSATKPNRHDKKQGKQGGTSKKSASPGKKGSGPGRKAEKKKQRKP